MIKIKLLSVIVLIGMMLMSSCSEDIVTSSLVINSTDSANLKITFYADLDQTLSGQEVVSGQQVVISTPNSSFNSAAPGTWSMTTTTSTSGEIDVMLPVGVSGTSYNIDIYDFVATKTLLPNSLRSSDSQQYIFSGSTSIDLYENGRSIIEFNLGGGDAVSSDVLTETYVLYINGEFDESSNGYDQLPVSNVTITGFTDGGETWVEELSNTAQVFLEGVDYTKFEFQAVSGTSGFSVYPITIDIKVATGDKDPDTGDDTYKMETATFSGSSFTVVGDNSYKCTLTSSSILP